MKESEVNFDRTESNEKVRRNAIVFFFLSALFQIAAGLLYGFFVRPTTFPTDIDKERTTVLPYFLTFVHSLLVVIGFGLLLSFIKENVWSGLGFVFFITAMTIEEYFLVNALWGWAGIEKGNSKVNGAFIEEIPVDKMYYFFAMSDSSNGLFGNTMNQAFKCSLANVVAFSAIIGRAGPLQAWLITFFGTIGYQLNRTVQSKYGFDGTSITTFIYGGFLGLVCGIFLRIHQKRQDNQTSKHKLYTANKLSSTMALLGTVFAFVTFPVLALDPKLKSATNNFTIYTAPLSIVFAMCGSTLTSMVFSQIYNNKLVIRDVIYGPIAGGVASATASFYIVNPVYAILIGCVAAIVQVTAHNLFQKKWANNYNIINSTSFVLFGIQGLIGCFFAAGWNAIVSGNSSSFTYVSSQNIFGKNDPIWEFVIGLMSAAFGIGFGILIGILIYIFSGHTRNDHFTDHTYWVDDDGISFQDRQTISDRGQEEDIPELDFKEGDHQVKNQHAYL